MKNKSARYAHTYLSESLRAEVVEQAQRLKITRSRLLRIAIWAGMDTVRDLKKAPLVDLMSPRHERRRAK